MFANDIIMDSLCAQHKMSIPYILAWVDDGFGLFANDIHHEPSSLSALQGLRRCKTVFSPGCCHDEYNTDLRVGQYRKYRLRIDRLLGLDYIHII